MGKRKQSAPQKSTKNACVSIGTLPAEPTAALERNPKRPRQHEQLDTSDEQKWDIIYLPELDNRGDAEIAEISLVNTTFVSAFHASGTAKVRLQYITNSTRGFGQYTVKDMCIEVVDTSCGSPSVILSGKLDGAEPVFSSLIFLVKKQFVGLRPSFNSERALNRVRLFITNNLFLACEADPGHMVRKHLQNLMVWLRPEVSVDAFYGLKEDGDKKETPTSQRHQMFDPSNLYDAIRRTRFFYRDEPCLNMAFEGLLPELRPYQLQAAYWMVQREQGDGFRDDGMCRKHPLWVGLDSLDKESRFYYNIFSGSVSREARDFCSYIRGGILADEMGLGKTVEVLACIVANRFQGPSSLESVVKTLEAKLNKGKKERIDCVCDDNTSEGIMIQCDYCDAWQHASCIGYSPHVDAGKKAKKSRQTSKTNKGFDRVWEDDRIFACGCCAELIGSVEVEGGCGTTLIVCPTPILNQWQEEITRHTKKGALKVLVYEGVQKGCQTLGDDRASALKIVGAHDLAAADIVITTYDVLRADFFHDLDDGNHRSMRFQKRYHVVATPLTKLQWWRVCLDEAQMVECNTARVTDMAMRLHARHRWCVSGTPIQRGLDDLYGLLRFLRAEPFDNYSWWIQAIKQPYEEGKPGAVELAHAYFREFMWRSTKCQVIDQLKIPPQEEKISWLKFSCIEAHFYRQQHDHCAKKAREVIGKCLAGDRPLNHIEASKLMNPLLRLRQACCHPQVGSAGIRSLQGSPMTMDEILEVLIEKAKTEGEEAQRNMLGALNGLAALAKIENKISLAVSMYREALAATEENANSFRVDPLQKLHTLYNLAELLGTDVQAEGESLCNIPRTLRDDLLVGQCQEIRDKYMSPHYAKLAAVQHEFYKITDEVSDAQSEDASLGWSNWWLDAFLKVQQSKDQGKELLDRIKHTLLEDSVSRNASSLALRFGDINGLKFLIQKELDAINHGRKLLLERLGELDKGMVNPLCSDVKRAGQCSQCQTTHSGITCAHCDMETLFQAYANRLLLLKSLASERDGIVSAEEALLAQQRYIARNRITADKGARNEAIGRTKGVSTASAAIVLNRPSETEQILSMLMAYVKTDFRKDGIAAAKKHLQYLGALRKEYAQARSLASSQRAVLYALDEVNMSTTRLCLQNPEDTEQDPFGVHANEIPQKNAQLTAEKFIAIDELSRAKGQFRYLKGLAQAREKTKGTVEGEDSAFDRIAEETCPICQDKLGSQLMVLPCGHLLCCKCMMLVVNRAHAPPGGAHLKRIACPTCRQRTYVSDVALAKTDVTTTTHNRDEPEAIVSNLEEGKEVVEEGLVTVTGSYGTKVEAVVRRILWIKGNDPHAKILVFSTWHDVLDVLEHALIANRITLARIKGRRKMDDAILKFKHTNVQVLLLPIQHGANGLNLVEAQHVMLVEPLLNPAAEAQAMNRVHRIGQLSETLVHRFIVCNTVEENIYRLGQRKSSSSLLPMKQKEQPLTISDMSDLFACDQPSSSSERNEIDDSNVAAFRCLKPAEAAAAAAEARLRQSMAGMRARWKALTFGPCGQVQVIRTLRRFRQDIWTSKQENGIKALFNLGRVPTRFRYRTLRRPKPPQWNRNDPILRADSDAGLARMQGQWMALQHQLGNRPHVDTAAFGQPQQLDDSFASRGALSQSQSAKEREQNGSKRCDSWSAPSKGQPVSSHSRIPRPLQWERSFFFDEWNGPQQRDFYSGDDNSSIESNLLQPSRPDWGNMTFRNQKENPEWIYEPEELPKTKKRERIYEVERNVEELHAQRKLEKRGHAVDLYMNTLLNPTSRPFSQQNLQEFPREQNIKKLLPGVAPGKGALVYNALYETLETGGWSTETVARLEKFKDGIAHPHQVCEVLKKLSNVHVALEFFLWARSIPGFKHDTMNYSTMIMILGDDGNYLMAERLFKEMVENSVGIDAYAINNMLRCYIKVNKIGDAVELYRQMPAYGCQPDSCTFTLFIDWYGKFGQRDQLHNMYMDLRRMPEKADAQVFNSMIYNFGKTGDVENAKEAASQMRKWGIPYSTATYGILIHVYAKAMDFQAASYIYADYLSSGLPPDVMVFNNAVLSCGKGGRLKDAEQAIADMEKAGLVPDKFTYCTIISSWVRKGGLEQAKAWFDKALDCGLPPSPEMCNALIDGYLKARMVRSAEKLMALMPSWGVKATLQTYTHLLHNYTTSRRLDARVIRELMHKTEHPADKFFTDILTGSADLKSASKEFFERMRLERPRWALSFANALVNYLHCFGYTREAYNVFEGASSTSLYPRGIWEELKDSWYIWLLDMEVGTALVALSKGLITCRDKTFGGFERPERILIMTGYTRPRSEDVTVAVYDVLASLNSPFEPHYSFGRFMCEGNLFRDWVLEPQVVRELNLNS